ncbi:MAG: phytanoyl-CoA dioxygenase family protein [Chitinophagales bacterium]|nr:phytanoyl-CoA dioxygenase family protein [Chitinophagales bacterium]
MSIFFKDNAVQQTFNKDGFVKLKMFSEEEAAAFKTFYDSLAISDEKKYGFSVSIDEMDNEVRKKLNAFFRSDVFPRFAEFLHQPKFFTGSYMIKEPYPTGTVAAHQDWTFVDETSYQSLMCWISLDKTDLSNGAMAFIRGGHLFFDQVRGFPCPLVPEPVEEFRYKLMPYMNVINTEPGDVLIFDNKTIHGSFPNTTQTTRHGISITLTQSAAEFVAYYLNPTVKDKYELVKYKVDDDFFDRYNNPGFHQKYAAAKMLDDLQELERITLIPQKKNWNEMLVLLEQHGNTFHPELEEKFGHLMNEQEKWHLSELYKLRNNAPGGVIRKIRSLLGV